jgi:hypothetical protein
MTTQSTVLIHLNEDDLPMCPKHGIRLPTDFFDETPETPEHEVGYCILCKRHYMYTMRKEKYL